MNIYLVIITIIQTLLLIGLAGKSDNLDIDLEKINKRLERIEKIIYIRVPKQKGENNGK